MTQADCVLSMPPLNTSRLQNIHEQEVARQEALRTVALLRRQAHDEIERLIAFLDASDGYTTNELEEGVDDTGCDEDTDSEIDDECDGLPDDEPSLGWTTTGAIQNTSRQLCDVEGCS